MKHTEITERIISYLDRRKLKKEQIAKFIGEIVDEELEKLELAGLIYKDKDGLYSLFPTHLDQGYVKIGKNSIKIITNKAKYTIEDKKAKDLLDGDIVIIKPVYSNDIIKEVKIEKILKRKDGNVIVDVKEYMGKKYIEPIDPRFKIPISLPNQVLNNYSYGDRLLVNIGQATNQEHYKGELVSFIGDKDDIYLDIKTLFIRKGCTIGHSAKSMEETRAIPKEVTKEDLIGRKDFRKVLTISIDGANSKDKDDAFSIVLLENGNILLMVHISDVSHYIKPGMSLWDEAMEKGFSSYPLNYVEPMLPKEISNGICSLNEKKDRLTETHMIELDFKGNVVDYQYVSGAINSDKSCTYEDVNRILENNEEVEGYDKEICDLLHIAEKVCVNIVEPRMTKRGCLRFKSKDIEVTSNSKGELTSIEEKTMGIAQRIIESFMLLTDEVAAIGRILPMIYRVHGEPDIEEVKKVLKYFKSLGIKIKYNIKSNTINSKQIQSILEQIKGTYLEDILSEYLIHAMKMAEYSAINIGHFALGLVAYIQVTSPIRRAGDLWNQYYMKKEREGNVEAIENYNQLYRDAYKLAGHLTEKELVYESIERESLDLATPSFYLKDKNEVFHAIITALDKNHIVIKTENGIKGTLSLNKNFVYNKKDKSYIDKENNFKLTIGTPIEVNPDRLNEKTNKLVFTLKK